MRRSLVGETVPEQASDPATPNAGELQVYGKADHKYYIKDSTGLVTDLTASGGKTFAFFAS